MSAQEERTVPLDQHTSRHTHSPSLTGVGTSFKLVVVTRVLSGQCPTAISGRELAC